jgi:hypothetical protein
MFYILLIILWLKFNIRRFVKVDIFYILLILLLCKSNTYNLFNSCIPFIFTIWFFGNNNTFNVNTAKFSIYLIWLSYRSIYNKLGNDIRFYILYILLCWNVNIFNFYSPYKSGIWFNYNESRFNFYKLVSRSHGRR